MAEYRPDAAARDPFFLCLRSEMKTMIADAVSGLDDKGRQVLALYYFEELTMKEVGLVLGVSESRVSQIHSMALLQIRAKLREKMEIEQIAFRRRRTDDRKRSPWPKFLARKKSTRCCEPRRNPSDKECKGAHRDEVRALQFPPGRGRSRKSRTAPYRRLHETFALHVTNSLSA